MDIGLGDRENKHGSKGAVRGQPTLRGEQGFHERWIHSRCLERTRWRIYGWDSDKGTQRTENTLDFWLRKSVGDDVICYDEGKREEWAEGGCRASR